MTPFMIPAGTSAGTGEMSVNDVAELQKALTAGYGTNMPDLTGGAALRIQSLDTVMQSTIQENKHFRLFNMLPKSKPGATVDEWTEQDRVGGFLGGSTNTETGVIAEFTGSYNRRVGMVKYLMAQRRVSVVQTLQRAIADSEATEYANGALQLLSDIEYFLFEGDDKCVPTEFTGIKAQMLEGIAAGQVDPENLIDMDGQPFNSIHPLNRASAQVRKYGNFGTATDVFFNQEVQADFDNALDPAFRIQLTGVGEGGMRLGAPVTGIRTSGGVITTQEDVFIRNQLMKQPFEVQYPVVALQNVGMKPATLTADATANDVSSKFSAPRAGNYYYLVCGQNAAGQSQGLVSAVVAVAAGKRVALTIAQSAGGQETGYVIYRSRQNGGNSIAGSVYGEGSDFREVGRIGRTGASTVFIDNNRLIPGSTEAYILNLTPGATAITWRQMLPMIKFPLYPTNAAVIPWAQLIFGFLRMSKRKHHALVTNIIPTGQTWKPFAA